MLETGSLNSSGNPSNTDDAVQEKMKNLDPMGYSSTNSSSSYTSDDESPKTPPASPSSSKLSRLSRKKTEKKKIVVLKFDCEALKNVDNEKTNVLPNADNPLEIASKSLSINVKRILNFKISALTDDFKKKFVEDEFCYPKADKENSKSEQEKDDSELLTKFKSIFQKLKNELNKEIKIQDNHLDTLTTFLIGLQLQGEKMGAFAHSFGSYVTTFLGGNVPPDSSKITASESGPTWRLDINKSDKKIIFHCDQKFIYTPEDNSKKSEIATLFSSIEIPYNDTDILYDQIKLEAHVEIDCTNQNLKPIQALRGNFQNLSYGLQPLTKSVLPVNEAAQSTTALSVLSSSTESINSVKNSISQVKKLSSSIPQSEINESKQEKLEPTTRSTKDEKSLSSSSSSESLKSLASAEQETEKLEIHIGKTAWIPSAKTSGLTKSADNNSKADLSCDLTSLKYFQETLSKKQTKIEAESIEGTVTQTILKPLNGCITKFKENPETNIESLSAEEITDLNRHKFKIKDSATALVIERKENNHTQLLKELENRGCHSKAARLFIRIITQNQEGPDQLPKVEYAGLNSLNVLFNKFLDDEKLLHSILLNGNGIDDDFNITVHADSIEVIKNIKATYSESKNSSKRTPIGTLQTRFIISNDDRCEVDIQGHFTFDENFKEKNSKEVTAFQNDWNNLFIHPSLKSVISNLQSLKTKYSTENNKKTTANKEINSCIHTTVTTLQKLASDLRSAHDVKDQEIPAVMPIAILHETHSLLEQIEELEAKTSFSAKFRRFFGFSTSSNTSSLRSQLKTIRETYKEQLEDKGTLTDQTKKYAEKLVHNTQTYVNAHPTSSAINKKMEEANNLLDKIKKEKEPKKGLFATLKRMMTTSNKSDKDTKYLKKLTACCQEIEKSLLEETSKNAGLENPQNNFAGGFPTLLIAGSLSKNEAEKTLESFFGSPASSSYEKVNHGVPPGKSTKTNHDADKHPEEEEKDDKKDSGLHQKNMESDNQKTNKQNLNREGSIVTMNMVN